MHLILTIGHSDHDPEVFLERLAVHRIEVLVDVRSHPYSRRLPQFSKSSLTSTLRSAGLRYLYLGEQLGGRPLGNVRNQMIGRGYTAMAATPAFKQAIDRVLTGAACFRLALMCAERDPIDCHRALLVGRALTQAGADLAHIHYDGHLESQRELDQRLLESAGQDGGDDLFSSPEELLTLAFLHQERRVCLTDDQDTDTAVQESNT